MSRIGVALLVGVVIAVAFAAPAGAKKKAGIDVVTMVRRAFHIAQRSDSNARNALHAGRLLAHRGRERDYGGSRRRRGHRRQACAGFRVVRQRGRRCDRRTRPGPRSVTASKLAPGAVSGATLADGSVTSAKIGAGQVKNPNLAGDAVKTGTSPMAR